MQVVKKKLSLVEPTLRTDEGFDYEEGEGLDNDEVEANKAKLPIMLDQQSGQHHMTQEHLSARHRMPVVLHVGRKARCCAGVLLQLMSSLRTVDADMGTALYSLLVAVSSQCCPSMTTLRDCCAGGGLQHGTVLYVEDQVQEFKVQIEVSHKVSKVMASFTALPWQAVCSKERGSSNHCLPLEHWRYSKS